MGQRSLAEVGMHGVLDFLVDTTDAADTMHQREVRVVNECTDCRLEVGGCWRLLVVGCRLEVCRV